MIKTKIARFLLFLTAAGLISAAITAHAEEDKIVFATFGEHAPYHWSDTNGESIGFDVDLANEIGKHLGKRAVVLRVPKTEVIPFVLEGKADAVLGITPSKEGEKIFDYSIPYLNHKTRLFVREGMTATNTIPDLRGVRVGVRKGEDVQDYLKILPGVSPTIEASVEQGLQDLKDKYISVYIGDEYESEYYIQQNSLRGITTLGGVFLIRKRSIAVAAGKTELLNEINKALVEIQADQTLQSLKDEWLVRRIAWSATGRYSLQILLIALGLVVLILMITLIFNHKLSEAVQERTMQVQSEHAHFENIFEHATDGIAVLDPETCMVVEANHAFEEMLQYTQAELDNTSLKELDATDAKDFASQIHRALVTGENVLFETTLMNKSNNYIDLVIHAKAFPYKDRTMVEAIARDITELKKIEALKDTILQDVAHELKTPLAKLSMSLDLLEKKIPEPEMPAVDKHLEVCRRAMIRLQNTIEGILNLSRLETLTPKSEFNEFSLNSLIRSVISELNMFAERKSVQIIDMTGDTEYFINGDLEMIRRLMVNLIHNAVKFTEKGSVKVALGCDGEFIKVSVQDQGIGLEKEDLSKIFNRFFQKSASYEGSGVGLTICQKIVTFHNGVIWASSDGIGKGTTMNVLFPIPGNTAQPSPRETRT